LQQGGRQLRHHRLAHAAAAVNVQVLLFFAPVRFRGQGADVAVHLAPRAHQAPTGGSVVAAILLKLGACPSASANLPQACESSPMMIACHWSPSPTSAW
jgi:hypothetical protein